MDLRRCLHQQLNVTCASHWRPRKITCQAQKRAQNQGVTLFGVQLVSHAHRQSLEQKFTVHKNEIAGVSAGLMAAGFLAAGGPAVASDFAKVGTCLLGNCQIRCGDLYQDKAIEAFTACAVSDKKCVPQRVDEDKFRIPPESALDENFDLKNFQGRWYITAGLNPLFDQFDCQEHYFGVPEPGKLYGNINWRIAKDKSDFIERHTIQTFKQVDGAPAKLENHGNAFLHYSDDWYILGYKPDTYAVIYYIGNNDAWKGYGGATVYTRSSTFPEEYLPEIKEKLKPMNLNWNDFRVTDNTCKPHPIRLNPLKQFEDFASEEVREVEDVLGRDLRSFGKGFTVIEQNISRELTKDEKEAEKELREAEDFLLNLRKKRSDGALKQDRQPSFFDNPLQFFKRMPPVQVWLSKFNP